MFDAKKRIGIWGYGVVGQAAAEFFSQQNATVAIMDSNHTVQSKIATQYPKSIFYTQEQAELFFNGVDHILVSPGVDIREHYPTIKDKLITELDIFNQIWQKPFVAVTGSVGKTSVVHFLTDILQHYTIAAVSGGNIGRASFDLFNDSAAHMAVVEVSSFQLERTQTFAPDLAIWTTFCENHLDRHGTVDDYFTAKLQIIAHQKPHQKALLPFSLQPLLKKYALPHTNISFFVDQVVTAAELAQLSMVHDYFALDTNEIFFWHQGQATLLLDASLLPTITFSLNWLIITAALHMLMLDIQPLVYIAQQLTPPPHRLELVATHNGVTYYNDSKATTVRATMAALVQLCTKPIYLLLGGLSKGVDRAPFIGQLPKHVVHVACFGAEADQLCAVATQAGIAASAHATLQEAFATCTAHATPESIVLLSPSGSSYDLFTNYEERGQHFKELVRAL